MPRWTPQYLILIRQAASRNYPVRLERRISAVTLIGCPLADSSSSHRRGNHSRCTADHDGGELFLPKMHPRTWTAKFSDKARQAAGLERGTLHSLRHTFISRAANNGTAIHLVSKWAGHSDLATTQVPPRERELRVP